MPHLRAHLLCLTALSGVIFSAGAAQAGTQLPLWGFENGSLTDWTGYGGTSVLATASLDLGGTTFDLGAKGNYMAQILPQGSTVMRTQAESLLGLSAGTFAAAGAAGLANSTNFGLITTSTYLAAGEYSFGWSYAAQDYAPFDDGVFFSLAGNGQSSVSILASNFTGQADTVLVGTYGSTPWRLTSFTIATAGTYQLGFGAYNNRDTGMDPVLFLDNGLGTLSANGVVVAPATPALPGIDNQQPYYVITNVENGSILPVFDGGTLLVDAAGTYNNPMTINGQGGTINSNGLDATLAATIDGTGGLIKIGDGTLTLTGANSYAGGTTISGGRLIASSVSLPGNVVNNATLEFAQASDGTYAGAISGSGNFVKSGAGILTLTGANVYTGGTTIEAGTLVGDTTSIQGDITNNATLELNQTSDGDFAGAIGGAGGLVKSGNGILILTGTSTYTGGTTIQAGTLAIKTNSLSGNIVNNATLQIDEAADSSFAGDISGTGSVVKTGTGTLILTGANSYTGDTGIQAGTLVGNTGSIKGNVANNGTLELNQTSDGTFAGVIGGSGALIKTGTGTLTLANSNVYTGSTTVSEGTLAINSASIIGDIANNATLKFDQASNGSFGGVISGTGNILKTGTGTLTLTAGNSYTGNLTIQGGTIVGNTASLKGNVANSGVIQFAQTGDGSFGGVVSGSGGLVKSGAGTLTLTGANVYTGGTAIQGGTLVGDTTSLQGDILNNAKLEFAQTTDGTFAGNIGGTGTLVKSGSGTLTLAGSNEGLNSNVTDGKLVIASQQAIGTSGGTVTLAGGTTLQTNGNLTISQIVNLVSGGSAANGAATIDTGANVVSFAGGGTGNLCLTKVGTGTLNMVSHVQNSIGACVNQGVMSFNNLFDGNVTVASTAKISGSGVINGSIIANGVVAPGNSPGVLVVNGSVTQQAGSTLALDIDGATAGIGAGHHDALVLNGTGSIYTADGLIAPILRGITGDANNNYTPTLGQTFEVVTAQGGVTGSFDGVTQPTSGMPANTRFDVLYRSNAILLVVTPGLYSLMGDVTNAAAAGGALDAIRPVAGVRVATANPIFERLAGLNAAQLGVTLEQLSGSVHASAMDATLQGNRAARGAILQHLKVERAATDGTTPRRGLWGSASTLEGTVKADRSGRGYQHDSQSYAIGFDVAPGADWNVGIAGTYGESKADAGLLGTGKTESYRGSLYAIWARAGSYATAQLGIGKDSYDLRRAATLTATPATLTADTDGTSYGAEIEAGHRFALGTLGVTPLLGLSYDRISRDGVQEAGNAEVALTFGKGRRTAWTGRAGARLDSGSAIAKGQIRAYGSGALVAELGDRSTSLAPSLQGAGFRIMGADAGKTAFQGEAGLIGALSSRIEVNVGYRHLSSDRAHANSVNGTLRVRW